MKEETKNNIGIIIGVILLLIAIITLGYKSLIVNPKIINEQQNQYSSFCSHYNGTFLNDSQECLFCEKQLNATCASYKIENVTGLGMRFIVGK